MFEVLRSLGPRGLAGRHRGRLQGLFLLDWFTRYGILSVIVTPPWSVEFYQDDEDGCPVRDFLDGLDTPRRAKVLAG